MNSNLYKRLARAEAFAELQKSELTETMMKAYENACDIRDREEAAKAARSIRNKLLNESDKQMTLDRLNIDTSGAINFIASVAEVFKSNWAVYRQALRDLPEQEGFPFEITFPVPPQEESDGIN